MAREILIPMFASRCPAAIPGRAFNDPPPYGVLGRLRVDGDTVMFDPVATALRPWLDGVRSVDYPRTRQFDPADGPRLREEFLRDVITPLVEEQFTKQPALRSCVMAVAQYWDDNAHDKVEVTFVLSELDTPDLTAENAWYNSTDPINRPNVRPGRAISLPRGYPYLTLIPLFAAFCPGCATQDDDLDQSYAPYAVFRRHKHGMEIETIGQPLRPWLEGRRVEVWAD